METYEKEVTFRMKVTVNTSQTPDIGTAYDQCQHRLLSALLKNPVALEPFLGYLLASELQDVHFLELLSALIGKKSNLQTILAPALLQLDSASQLFIEQLMQDGSFINDLLNCFKTELVSAQMTEVGQ